MPANECSRLEHATCSIYRRGSCAVSTFGKANPTAAWHYAAPAFAVVTRAIAERVLAIYPDQTTTVTASRSGLKTSVFTADWKRCSTATTPWGVTPNEILRMKMRDANQQRRTTRGSVSAITNERIRRALRNLRKYGWIVHSSRDAGDLREDEYRLEQIGAPIWLGKSKHGGTRVSEKTRRDVFDRDGHRCLLCGIGAGETYPDQPHRRARLTLGHFVADALRGAGDPANLRTECARCNEPVKEEAQRSESAAEIWPKVRGRSRADKTRLLTWISNGYRERDAIDRLFDQVRALPALQRDEIRSRLERSILKRPQYRQ